MLNKKYRAKLEKQIATMQACLEGKKIEFYAGRYNREGNLEVEWLEAGQPTWSWSQVEYRIKPDNQEEK